MVLRGRRSDRRGEAEAATGPRLEEIERIWKSADALSLVTETAEPPGLRNPRFTPGVSVLLDPLEEDEPWPEFVA